MKKNKLKTKVIVVTDHDIQHGKPRSFTQCPIARATRRAFCYKKRCRVDGGGGIFVGKKGSFGRLKKVKCLNQVDVWKFVCTFDMYQKVTPIKIKIMYS